MLDSLKRELKKFEKKSKVLVQGGNLLPINNVTIVKENAKTKKILSDSDIIRYLGPETGKIPIPFHNFCKDLNIDLSKQSENDIIKDYGEYFNTESCSCPSSFKRTREKITFSLLDLITSAGEQKFLKSPWGIYSRSKVFYGIGAFGEMLIKQEDRISLNEILMFNNKPFYLELTGNKYEDNVTILEKLTLKLTVSYHVKDMDAFKNYMSKKHLKFLFRIVESDFMSPKLSYDITVAVEIPKEFTSEKEDSIITANINIAANIFHMMLSALTYKKKLFKNFGGARVTSNIKDVKNEKHVWFGESNDIRIIRLLDLEAKFLDEKIFPHFNGMHKNRRISWERLYSIMKDFETFYSEFENENISVPSGPDTSKFTATKSGWVKLDKDFNSGVTQYSCGSYFKYGLKVGGNYQFGNPFGILKYILIYISRTYGLPLYSDKSSLYIRSTSGTNWSAIGIG